MWQTIKQHRDSKTLIMGVSWYRPEQWERLREISADKETFAISYDASLVESVQRGLQSPHAKPGPLAPDEDGVYQFVSRVAKAYSGGAARG